MVKTVKTLLAQDFVYQVKHLIAEHIDKMTSFYWCTVNTESLMPGKMLRTRLAAQLAACDAMHSNIDTLVSACIATELVHTASLCHDDVIDNGVIRRGLPTIWRITGPSSAILIGDMLLCEAIDVLQNTADGRYVSSFVAKVRETCIAEIEQEITLRGERPNEHTCIRIARGKTGPLFAFIGLVYGGDDSALSSALENAGYHIGTAYQLADDLIDIVGDENLSGKTLGSDSKRGKYTFPQSSVTARSVIHEMISEQCLSALNCLSEWPHIQNGLEKFLEIDLQGAFDKINTEIEVSCLIDIK